MSMPSRLFPSLHLWEIVANIADDLGETFICLAESTKHVILSEVDRDRQQVQQAIAYGEYAASQLAPPVLKMFYHNLFNMAVVSCSSDYGKKAHIVLAECYLWTALCHVAYVLGGVFGSMPMTMQVLKPVLLLTNAFVISMFVLPVYLWMFIRTTWCPPYKARSLVLRACFVIGLLLAYSNGHPHSWSPPVFFVPLWIGFVTCYRASGAWWPSERRSVYLAISTLVPLLVHMVINCITIRSVWYPHYTSRYIAISLVACVDLQLKLGRIRYGWCSENLELVVTTMTFVLTQSWCECDTSFLADTSFLPSSKSFLSRRKR